MAINGRRKGAKAERLLAHRLGEWTGKEFSKTPASGGLRWNNANVAGDIVCTTEGHYCPFCFEVKSYSKIDFSHLLLSNTTLHGSLSTIVKNVDILDFWNQAKRDARRAGKIPILMMRYNGLPKGFYYVVLGKSFMSVCTIKPRAILNFISEKNNLWITTSEELFRTDYRTLRKIAKIHLKKLYGNKKTKNQKRKR